jgi:hypothetical protein
MGKRSTFDRRQDYATPLHALEPVIPFLKAEGIRTFAEPCCGAGNLVSLLENVVGLRCVYSGDITQGLDARAEFSFGGCNAIITNPPWRRDLMHPLIDHFLNVGFATYLLFDADWPHTKQAAPFLPYCSHIISAGRVKWIPGSKYTGKDNAAWFRFQGGHRAGPHFYGFQPREVAA